ncbi:MAG: glycosyltransferase [Prevotella sp.]|nr:glycosyltransferase [Prevotella sp.]
MHILEIPSFFHPYGGMFCLEQSKALAALGHEVRILSNVQLGITIGWKDYLTLPWRRYEHQMGGVTVYQSYQRGIPKMIRPNVDRWVSVVCSMFAEYIEKYGCPDILHAHCAKWAGYAAMRLSEEYKIPYVVTEHLPKEIFHEEFGDSTDHWQIPLLKESYRRATRVMMVSEELVDDIACYFGKDYQYVTVSNIIDVDFYAYRPRPSMDNRPFRFCCPALFVERKGYDVLLEAFNLLYQQNPNIELVIAGQGTDSEAFRNLYAQKACRQQVRCMGVLDKEGIRDMYYHSDALVLATRGESQGLVLLEALSTGIPVVSTEAIPPSVRMRDGAVYVPVDDVEAFMKAMARVMDYQYDGQTLSKQVATIASPMAIGKKIEAVLRTSLHTV